MPPARRSRNHSRRHTPYPRHHSRSSQTQTIQELVRKWLYDRVTSFSRSSWLAGVFKSAGNTLGEILSTHIFNRRTIDAFFQIDLPYVMKPGINVSSVSSEQE